MRERVVIQLKSPFDFYFVFFVFFVLFVDKLLSYCSTTHIRVG